MRKIAACILCIIGLNLPAFGQIAFDREANELFQSYCPSQNFLAKQIDWDKCSDKGKAFKQKFDADIDAFLPTALAGGAFEDCLSKPTSGCAKLYEELSALQLIVSSRLGWASLSKQVTDAMREKRYAYSSKRDEQIKKLDSSLCNAKINTKYTCLAVFIRSSSKNIEAGRLSMIDLVANCESQSRISFCLAAVSVASQIDKAIDGAAVPYILRVLTVLDRACEKYEAKPYCVAVADTYAYLVMNSETVTFDQQDAKTSLSRAVNNICNDEVSFGCLAHGENLSLDYRKARENYDLEAISRRYDIACRAGIERKLYNPLSFSIGDNVCEAAKILKTRAKTSLSDTLNFVGDILMNNGVVHHYEYEDCKIGFDQYDGVLRVENSGTNGAGGSYDYYRSSHSVFVHPTIDNHMIKAKNSGNPYIVEHYVDAFVIDLQRLEKSYWLGSKLGKRSLIKADNRKGPTRSISYPFLKLPRAVAQGVEITSGQSPLLQRLRPMSQSDLDLPSNMRDYKVLDSTPGRNPPEWMASHLSFPLGSSDAEKVANALNHAAHLCRQFKSEELTF